MRPLIIVFLNAKFLVPEAVEAVFPGATTSLYPVRERDI